MSMIQNKSEKRIKPVPIGHRRRPLFAKRMIVGGQHGVFIPLLPTADVEKIEDWINDVDPAEHVVEHKLAS
jgi:hypothetical protein